MHRTFVKSPLIERARAKVRAVREAEARELERLEEEARAAARSIFEDHQRTILAAAEEGLNVTTIRVAHDAEGPLVDDETRRVADRLVALYRAEGFKSQIVFNDIPYLGGHSLSVWVSWVEPDDEPLTGGGPR